MNALGTGFKKFFSIRIVVGIVIVLVVLWALGVILGLIGRPDSSDKMVAHSSRTEKTSGHVVDEDGRDVKGQGEKIVHASDQEGSVDKGHTVSSSHNGGDDGHTRKAAAHDMNSQGSEDSGHVAAGHQPEKQDHAVSSGQGGGDDGHTGKAAAHDMDNKDNEDSGHAAAGHQTVKQGHGGNADDNAHAVAVHQTDQQPMKKSSHGKSAAAVNEESAAGTDMSEGGHFQSAEGLHSVSQMAHIKIKGVTFVEASIKPLKYELEERFWGWRVNDIINVTDNVNNFQLGVLEVTRRTTVALAERISRTGTNASYDKSLENAMNWFMVKADRYWFPSPESKFKDGLSELEKYMERLKAGEANFYTRTDNLIPLLASFEDLLGSCDENLVKTEENDGSEVSFFSADDYYFYTKGVASSMLTVLEAIHHDFLLTLESRNATELLHHAIESCKRAVSMDPWIILDRPYDSTFANHRANMAAPISHARFYIGALIKTLST